MSRIEQALIRAASSAGGTPNEAPGEARPIGQRGLTDFAREAEGATPVPYRPPPQPPERPHLPNAHHLSRRTRDDEWDAQLRDDIDRLRQRVNAATER